MSLLAPLYFAGALAIALPILFHLIRQRPKTQREFSSLIFLDETPPRLTRRSKLDQWPLLLLRSLALLLLAAAFARPFFRSIDVLDAQSPPQRVVLLVDTSASMQRSGLWTKTIAEAERVIADLNEQDRLAIISFDRKPTTWMRLDESALLSLDARQQTARTILVDLKPTWNATDISAALIAAADATTDDAEASIDLVAAAGPEAKSTAMLGNATVHLISDMQAGGNVSQLQSFVWPTPVQVVVRVVSTDARTNAAAFVMVNENVSGSAGAGEVHVRVVNSPESQDNSFSLAWRSEMQPAARVVPARVVPVQVPPGQTRIVRMPAPPEGTSALVLQGDDHDFDNTRYFSITAPRPQTIGFIDNETDDSRRNLFYYLGRAPLDDRTRIVTVKRFSDAEIAAGMKFSDVPLVVVASGLSTEASAAVRTYVNAGGRVLFVLDDPDRSTTMTQAIDRVVGSNLRITEAVVDDYHMLSQIQFSDVMFDAMADPQFNDFTRVRFWSHRSVDGLDDWDVTARFDDGDVALARKALGSGQCMLLTAGWQPRSSQLALSTKFIPLVSGWLGASDARLAMTEVNVGDPLTIATKSGSTESPGLVTVDDDIGSRTISINVAASESETEPIGDELLEQFGITVGQTTNAIDREAARRQLRDRELENRQDVWRWLLLAALLFLALETWWAGRLSRTSRDKKIDLQATT